MALIEFYYKEKLLARTALIDRSTQAERDGVAKKELSEIDYQIFDAFTITENDGSNPRSAELTEYFQDSQGRIWKSLNDEK